MLQSILDKGGSAMTAPFRAFVVDQTADGFKMGIQQLEQRDLPPGDVLIQVAYAAVNYKDALVCTPNGNVARTYPLVPGLELTGAVVESTDPRFHSSCGASRCWASICHRHRSRCAGSCGKR
jgi:NADPH:quinone reductase-like Zn-dependent oxidoreductase